MPRPPRLHVPGGYYHVILRGNHREDLFGSIADRLKLNDIVADVMRCFGCRIHAFCWMTNHLHALIQIADQPLGKPMQRIAVRYSKYRHRALRTRGHLFERRYKARLVDVDTYFLTLLRYIHLNPVKANIVTDPAAYPWSSHRAFLGHEEIAWLTTDFGLSLFSTDLARARVAYEQFILNSSAGSADLDDECHPEDSRILGDDKFINKLPVASFTQRSQLTLEQLAEPICRQHGISVDRLRSASRARWLTPIRITFAVQALEQRVGTLCDVARFMHRDPSAISRLLTRHDDNQ